MVGILKRGRKPFPEGTALDANIVVRCTREMEQTLFARYGHKNVSGLIRRLLQEELRRVDNEDNSAQSDQTKVS